MLCSKTSLVVVLSCNNSLIDNLIFTTKKPKIDHHTIYYQLAVKYLAWKQLEIFNWIFIFIENLNNSSGIDLDYSVYGPINVGKW